MLVKLKGLFSRSPTRHRQDVTEDIAEGSVRIEGKTYALKRWSKKTFIASPCGPHLSDGDEVSIDVSINLGGTSLDFSGLATIVQADADKNEIHCRFLDIERAAQAAIDRHFAELERNRRD